MLAVESIPTVNLLWAGNFQKTEGYLYGVAFIIEKGNRDVVLNRLQPWTLMLKV